MSRIFDALQRSGVEQTGVEYPDMVSVAMEVFEAPLSGAPVTDPAPPFPGLEVAADLPVAQSEDASRPEALEFPSLKVCAAPGNRLVFLTEPDSLAVEKFRFLGVRLRQLRQNRKLKKVLITSTIPGEGKSLVAANLAGVLARRKERVLLIEGDLRRPTLADQFGLRGLAGLAEWLQSGLTAPSNIYHLAGPAFWFMPAGSTPANPLELMQSGRLSALMQQVSDHFDWIIVDSPPLLPLADTTVWARLTDGALLVAREGTTQKAALERGLEILKKSEMLGVVLNGCSNSGQQNYYQAYAALAAKAPAK